LALNLFYLFSPPATAVLGARRCQQECDANEAACFAGCEQGRTDNSPDWDNNPDYQNCTSDCDADWTHCSMTALTCGSGSGDVCFSCSVHTQVVCTGVAPYLSCYQAYQDFTCFSGTGFPYCY
jgi:hypothetical protein